MSGVTDAYSSATDAFKRQGDDYTAALKRRNEAIEAEVLRFRDSIREPILGTADLLSNFGGRAEVVRADDIVAMLENRTVAVDRFGAALATLRARASTATF